MGAMDPALHARLAALRDADPARRLDCLVTLAPGVDPAALLPGQPTLWVALTRLAAVALSAEQALALAADPRVERLELDGQAWAIGG